MPCAHGHACAARQLGSRCWSGGEIPPAWSLLLACPQAADCIFVHSSSPVVRTSCVFGKLDPGPGLKKSDGQGRLGGKVLLASDSWFQHKLRSQGRVPRLLEILSLSVLSTPLAHACSLSVSQK